MLSTTKSSVIKALFLSTALIITPVHATATAGKIATNVGKLGKGGWVGVGVQIALAGAGWVIEEGQKVRREKEQEEWEKLGGGTDTQADTQTSSQVAMDTAYPLQYIFDGKEFANAQEVHNYAISDAYLKKRGFYRTRNQEGLYYDKLSVFIGYNMYPYRGIGKTESTVLVAPIGATYPQNIGGYKETFRGEILTKGRISETDIRLSDDYKAQREAAAKEIARQIEATSTDANASDIDKIIKELQKAKESKDKIKDKAKEKTDEKADEKTKEKEQGKDKPFELPDFCVFAKFVCDFLEQEPPAPEAPKTIPKANLSDLGLQDDIDKKRIDFTGTCPTKEMTFTLRGQTIHEAVPMYHLCNLLEKIAPWLVGFTYLSCVIFIVRSV